MGLEKGGGNDFLHSPWLLHLLISSVSIVQADGSQPLFLAQSWPWASQLSPYYKAPPCSLDL